MESPRSCIVRFSANFHAELVPVQPLYGIGPCNGSGKRSGKEKFKEKFNINFNCGGFISAHYLPSFFLLFSPEVFWHEISAHYYGTFAGGRGILLMQVIFKPWPVPILGIIVAPPFLRCGLCFSSNGWSAYRLGPIGLRLVISNDGDHYQYLKNWE